MSQIVDDKVYARLEDGELKEYPVLGLHIKNRGQPVDWYVEVQFADKPEVPPFHNLEEIVTPSRDLGGKLRVNVTYRVTPTSLQDILNTLRQPGSIPGMPGDQPLPISEIPIATVQRVAYLATVLAQEKLDAFAATENYDGLLSAVSYRGSSVAKFDAEGHRAFALRDQMWLSLYDYLGKVQSGQVPVPLTVAEIEAQFPALTWQV